MERNTGVYIVPWPLINSPPLPLIYFPATHFITLQNLRFSSPDKNKTFLGSGPDGDEALFSFFFPLISLSISKPFDQFPPPPTEGECRTIYRPGEISLLLFIHNAIFINLDFTACFFSFILFNDVGTEFNA